MSQGLRVVFGLAGGVALLLAVAFLLRAEWALALWPFQPAGGDGYGSYGSGDPGLGPVFLASILAAIAASVLWIAATGEGRAIAGGALDLVVMGLGGLAAGLWALVATGETRQLPLALAAGGFGIGFLLLFRRWRREPFRDPRPMPAYVRAAFGLFVVLLGLVGLALALRWPHVFPWRLDPGSSVAYGLTYLGAMTYFLYGLRHPAWSNAAGQLLGFLAYDLVLIVPFLRLFGRVEPAHLTSLVAYTAVVARSGLLAAYALFLDPRTRLGTRSRPPAAA